MRMHALPTRRDFTLGFMAVGTIPLASRWAFGFSPAEAETSVEPAAPIAPIAPKTFKEFGGVRIDNYD